MSIQVSNPLSDVALGLFGIDKRFGQVSVLKGVTLEFHRGEVHAIVGENGAGKSTLMHILAGVYAPDAGSLHFEGREFSSWRSEQEAIAQGIAIVYQERSLFPHLNIAENIFAGRTPIARRPLGQVLKLIDYDGMHRQSAELLVQVGLQRWPLDLVQELSQAEQQQVEIAKALSQQAKVLILDEPTACLSHTEVQRLFECLRRLRTAGVTIVYISHRLEEVFTIADRVTVLKDGVIQATQAIAETNPRQLVSLMVGRPWEASGRRISPQRLAGQARLSVRGLEDVGSRPLLRGVSFEVYPGEIVALAGLVGAGRSEVLLSLFGARGPIRANIEYQGRTYQPASPRAAIARGMALLTEDRRRTGMFHELSLSDNLVSAAGPIFGRWWWDSQRARSAMQSSIDKMNIVCRSVRQPIEQLSGGNQQKVLLSRWLLRAPQLLMLDEPTRGVDVAAKEEIHSLVRKLADAGTSVLLVSSELPEVLALADTICVIREGKSVGACTAASATEEHIMELASIATTNSAASSNQGVGT